jgi:hypothetical protein
VRTPKPAVLLGLVLVVGLLAACGDSEDGASGAEEPSTRVVEGAYGEITVPAEPQRIFADR